MANPVLATEAFSALFSRAQPGAAELHLVQNCHFYELIYFFLRLQYLFYNFKFIAILKQHLKKYLRLLIFENRNYINVFNFHLAKTLA